jgi:hypothetical protein
MENTGAHRRECDDDMKRDLGETGCKFVDWIHLWILRHRNTASPLTFEGLGIIFTYFRSRVLF